MFSYVVFADWLFFGLTAGALMTVRAREPSPGGAVARAPGHPLTTALFIAVAIGIVLNSFVAYPTQSLVGSAILAIATIVFFVSGRPRGLPDDSGPASRVR